MTDSNFWILVVLGFIGIVIILQDWLKKRSCCPQCGLGRLHWEDSEGKGMARRCPDCGHEAGFSPYFE